MRLPSGPVTVAGSTYLRMKRLDHCSDLPILENDASSRRCSPDGDTDHGPGQVVGANYQAGEQHPKRGVDRAQQAVAEIRFFAGFYGVDVCGPEDVDAGEPRLF